MSRSTTRLAPPPTRRPDRGRPARRSSLAPACEGLEGRQLLATLPIGVAAPDQATQAQSVVKFTSDAPRRSRPSAR